MKIVSIINYKGGVGKTTTTANLAGDLAWRGYNVLLIDLDPQASLTFSFISPENWVSNFAKDRTIKRWFDALGKGERFPLKDLIFTPEKANNNLIDKGRLDLLPSHLGLINVDLELATDLAGGTLKQAKQKYLKVHQRLAQGLEETKDDDYDVVLIDCPPNFNIVTKNAIVASDNILIPAKPDYLSTLGIDYLQRNVNELIEAFNDYATVDDDDVIEIEPEILGVVFTMVQFYNEIPISSQIEFMARTRDLGLPVFDSHIRENKSLFGGASMDGIPVVLNYYSNPTHSNIVSELEELGEEFIDKLGL